MINRRNWKEIKKYLAHRRRVDQVSESTLKNDKGRLRHLLEWADETRFSDAAQIQPSFSEYLANTRLDGIDRLLSAEYSNKIVRTARRFLEWLVKNRPGYQSISERWLDTLRSPRNTSPPRPRKVVTIDEVLEMVQTPVDELWEKRIQAAIALLYSSGARINAFASLPLSAVDVTGLSIKQWPSLGVRTKLYKHATTYLLPIPELIQTISEWDSRVRAVLPDDGYWFAPLSPFSGAIDPTVRSIGKYRAHRIRKDLRRWLEMVNLPYHSPHAFRHGHAVYAIKHAQDVGQLKAISQNLMHSNLNTTDGIYGILSERDVHQRISELGKKDPAGLSKSDETILNQLSRIERLIDDFIESAD